MFGELLNQPDSDWLTLRRKSNQTQYINGKLYVFQGLFRILGQRMFFIACNINVEKGSYTYLIFPWVTHANIFFYERVTKSKKQALNSHLSYEQIDIPEECIDRKWKTEDLNWI